jgi:hypothetical protein
MSITLSARTEADLRWLLQTGRWHSEVEIICHGLDLVKSEVQQGLDYLNPPPLPAGTLERIYFAESAEERELERRVAEASMRASRIELDQA